MVCSLFPRLLIFSTATTVVYLSPSPFTPGPAFNVASIALALPSTAPINASPSSTSPLQADPQALSRCWTCTTTLSTLKTYLSSARSAFTESRNISSDHFNNLSRMNSSTKSDVPSNKGRRMRGVTMVIRTFMLQLFAGSLADSSATNSTTPRLLNPETDCH